MLQNANVTLIRGKMGTPPN